MIIFPSVSFGGTFNSRRSTGLSINSNGLSINSNGLSINSNGLSINSNGLSINDNINGKIIGARILTVNVCAVLYKLLLISSLLNFSEANWFYNCQLWPTRGLPQ